jgi:hypothetical protein
VDVVVNHLLVRRACILFSFAGALFGRRGHDRRERLAAAFQPNIADMECP